MDDNSLGLYHPLREGNTIRLLKISHPVLEGGSPLTMEEHSLDNDDIPSFFGLSYCWGSPDRSQTLLVNHSSVRISLHLHQGLEELAVVDEFNGAYFWIDQICVNQNDLIERSHQVTLMQRIYRAASRTVIWLSSHVGPTDAAEPYDRGWELAEKLHNFGHTRADWSEKIDFLKVPYPLARVIPDWTIPSLDLPDFTDGSWHELKSILCNPWFSRMWILQEAALSRVPASIVHAGHSRRLEHILWAGAWLWRVGGPREAVGIPLSAISNVYTIFTIVLSAIPWRIEPLLKSTCEFGATDQRDKVIALLGLAAPETLPRSWVPDYQHSATEIYRDVTRAIVQETGQLLILGGMNYNFGQRYHTPRNLPFWVPRFHDPHAPVVVTTLVQNEEYRAADKWREEFNACCGKQVQVLKQDDPNILALRGLDVDEVVWVSSIMDEDKEEPHRLLRWLEEAMRRFCAHKEESPTTFVEGFFRSAANAKRTVTATISDLQEYLSQFGDEIPNQRSLSQLLKTVANENDDKGDAQNIWIMENSFFKSVTSMFVTKQENFGFGPKSTAVGDFVAVIYGSEAPVVVRRHEDRHTMLGFSYVPGLMEGEGINRLEKGKIKENWFSFI